MKLIFLLSLIALVYSQAGAPVPSPCSNPCYGTAASACPAGYYCGKSVSTTVKPGCENICYPEGATRDVMLTNSDGCKACIPSMCSSSEVCNFNADFKCYNCDCAGTNTACTVDPCDNTCAKTIGARCVRDCTTCTAKFYDTTGNEVCTKPDQCTPCSITSCPTGSDLVRSVDVTTGCEVCKCVEKPVCPTLMCPTVYCPYGYVVDAKGCPTCECNKCPRTPQCSNLCPYGYKNDALGCPTCECQPSTCPVCDFSLLNCNNFAIDPTTGCKLCKCAECPKLDCLATNIPCAGGYIIDRNGCPTCDCSNCTKYCPYGTKSTDPTSPTCDCNCPVLNCLVDCKTGYKIDNYGCKSCECQPDLSVCSLTECNLNCQFGYAIDANGCKQCKCVDKPLCPEVLCTEKCAYGYLYDSNNCPTCRCEPCPAVKCSKLCPYGFQIDSSGCPTCICNEKPVCASTSATDPTFTSSCNLKCSLGYKTKDGCPVCSCEDVTPCTCPAPNPDEKPTVCSDGFTKTEVVGCNRDATTNKCELVRRRCPVCIGIETKDGSLLTDTDIKRIKIQYNIPDVEVKIDIRKDGTKTIYVICINPEALPADFNFQNIVDYQQTVNSNSIAYVISSNPTTPSKSGAFAVIAPLLAIIFVMLM